MNTTYRAPLADLEFLLLEVLEVAQLRALPSFATLDDGTVRSILAQGARFAETVLSPINGPGDAEGARLEAGQVRYPEGFAAAYAQYAADGWLGLDLPERAGGQGLSRLLQAAFAEMTNGANLAFCMLPVTIRAAARLLLEHGSPALQQQYLPGLVDGSCAATIAISEPQAGSDVGRLQSLARPQPDGSFLLSGNKIFISNAGHQLTPQIAHMVLARTPDAPPGTRGISLFLVPEFVGTGAAQRRNGVQVVRVEHKMGLKASPTCAVEFQEARAIQIGATGRGLQAMFAMVNTMRLEVAIQGVGIAAAATQRAMQYAQERLQGGAPDARPVKLLAHADVRRMLLTMRARTEAIRGLTLEAALQLDLGENSLDAAVAERARAFAQWLLPICKAYATDTALDVANLAVQVFGGYGYVTDSGVEQYVRDVRVGAIYEGTNGIQAIDLVTRKLVGDGGERLGQYLDRMREAVAVAAGDAELAAPCAVVASGIATLERVSRNLLLLAEERRHDDLEAGAVAYLRLAGAVGGAWMLLRQATRATRTAALHRAKRRLAVFHADHLSPEIELYAAQALAGAAATALSDEEWRASS